jgi:histidinol-phosphate aminotransferase
MRKDVMDNAQPGGPAPAWLKATVAALPAYRGPQTAASVAKPGARMRILHLNESPYPPSPRAIEAFAAAAASLNRYPDIFAAALAGALAGRTGVAPERIVFGCGSDELIHLLCEITLGPGDELVIPAPSFPRYALSARILGATPVRTRLDAGGANDPAALARAVTPRTKMVFCCTPNPPSGGLMSEGALDALVRDIPDEVLLVVDEAYHEFGRHAGGPDVIAALRRRQGPWVVLRTFSKAYGLAGARVGYALCGSDAVVDALRKIKMQFNITVASQAAALAALEDEAYLARTLDTVARERTRLSEGMTALGLSPFPTAANFVSARLAMPASAAAEEFRKRGILIRDWRDPEHLNEIRITVGLPDDTDAVLAALREIVAG